MDIMLSLSAGTYFIDAHVDTSHSEFRLIQDAGAVSHRLSLRGPLTDASSLEANLDDILHALRDTLDHDRDLRQHVEAMIEIERDRADRQLTQFQRDSNLRLTAENFDFNHDEREGWADVATARRALSQFSDTARAIVLALSSDEHAGIPVSPDEVAEMVGLSDGSRAVAAAVRQGFTSTCDDLARHMPIRIKGKMTDKTFYVVPADWAAVFRSAADGLVTPIRSGSHKWAETVPATVLSLLVERSEADYPFWSFKELAEALMHEVPGLSLNYRRDIPDLLAEVQRSLYALDPSLPWLTLLVQTGRGKPSSSLEALAEELDVDLAGLNPVEHSSNPWSDDPERVGALIERLRKAAVGSAR